MHRSVSLKLLTLARGIQFKNLAEIGVWLGETSYFFSQFFPEAHLYLIDPWKPSKQYLENGQGPSHIQQEYDWARKNAHRLFQNNSQVSILQKTSHDALSLVLNHLDLVFIDGNHSYRAVKDDIQNWRRKIRRGELLTGHNYHPNFLGLIRAVHSCLKDQFKIGEDTIRFTQAETG